MQPTPHTSTDADPLLDELLEEITQKLRNNDPIDLDSYARQHPHLAEPLHRLVPGIEALVDLGHARSSSPSPNSAFRIPGYSLGAEIETLGDFQLFRELGRGGMGVVYEAEQISLGRRVALKILPFAAILDERQLRRFKNEAQAAAMLKHPNIVSVYGIGCERSVHFYAMELIEGQSLAETIQGMRNADFGLRNEEESASQSAIRNPKSPIETQPIAALSTERSTNPKRFFRRVAELGIQAAEALAHAHEQGVLHRDVKPANLLLDRDGQLYVTDFGLARIGGDATVTATGDLVGTLRYMSPEQLAGKGVVVDHRSDVYSLGVTLYELATGRPAFPGDDRQTIARRIASEDPPPPRRIDNQVPPDLETILIKATEKDPQDRYASAAALAADLKRYVGDQPIAARPPSLLGRTKKWLRRHPAAAATGLIASGLVIIGLAIGSVLLAGEQAKTQAALDEKSTALDAAESNLLLAADTIDHLLVRYATDAESHGDLHHADAFFKEATSFYSRLLARTDNREIRRRAAAAYARVGETQDLLGLHEDAKVSYTKAVEACERLVEESPHVDAHQTALAAAYNGLANTHDALEEYADAEGYFLKALAIHEARAAESPGDPDRQYALAIARAAPAFVYLKTDRLEDAQRLYDEALPVFDKLPSDVRQNPAVLSQWGSVTGNLGLAHLDRGDLAAAKELLDKAYWLHFFASTLQPENRELRLNVYYANWNWADLQIRLGNHAVAARVVDAFIKEVPDLLQAYVEGIELLHRAADLATSQDGPPPSPDPRPAQSYRSRAGELLAASERADWTTPEFQSRMSWLLLSYPDESLRDVERAEKLIKEAIDQIPTRPDFHWTHAAAHYYAGDYDGAIAEHKKAADLGSDGAWDWLLLAMIHAARADHEESMRWFEKANAWIKATGNADEDLHRFRAETLHAMKPYR